MEGVEEGVDGGKVAEHHEDHDHEEEGHHHTGHHRTTTGHQHTAHLLRMDHMVDIHHSPHQTEGLSSQNFEQNFSKNCQQGTVMSPQGGRCISLILMNILILVIVKTQAF